MKLSTVNTEKKTCLVYILQINDHINRHTLLTQSMPLNSDTWAHQLGRKRNIKQTFLNISVCSFKSSIHWQSLFMYYYPWSAQETQSTSISELQSLWHPGIIRQDTSLTYYMITEMRMQILIVLLHISSSVSVFILPKLQLHD
jgi:hypothetical protein